MTAARTASSQRALSVAIALISGGVVAITLATAGQAVSAERSVLSRIDDAQVSTIQVLDDDGSARLDAGSVEWLRSLNTVAWALGLGPVVDVRPTGLDGAEPVPARQIIGSSPLLQLHPEPGIDRRAYLGPGSADLLGLPDVAGAVEATDGRQTDVGGYFEPAGPAADLGDAVLIVDPSFVGPVRRVLLQVERPEDVVVTADAIRATLGGTESGARVEVAEDLALVRAAVRGELGGAGRDTVLQTLGAGLALAALTIYAGLQGRRKDFGRRRALGATRAQLTLIVVVQVVLAALPGVVLGGLGGAIAVTLIAGTGPGWTYPVAVGGLTLAAMGVAAMVPAVFAAWRDPIAALRVP